MRIIAGKWRGRTLAAPPGDATRPTADRVREALFSMLTSRLGSFEGLRVADVFAGTGALGLEALSRGAAHVVFVDSDLAAVKVLRANIAALGCAATTDIIVTPTAAIGTARQACDVLLLDPPYGGDLAPAAVARLDAQGWIAPHALLAVETGAKELICLDGFACDTRRTYGKTLINLFRKT